MEQNIQVLNIVIDRANEIWDAMKTTKSNLESETNPKFKRMFKKMLNEYRIQWHALTQTIYVIKRDLGL